MPVYSFECSNCRLKLDKFLAYSSRDVPVECLSCGYKCRRLYSAPATPTVTELGDKYHGRSFRVGMKDVLEKRSRQDIREKVGEIIETKGASSLKGSTLFNDKGSLKSRWDDK